MSKVKKYSHYRPHGRVPEFGQVLDPGTGEFVTPPSMAKQEFKRECDINNIVKHFSTHGMLNHVNAKAAQGAYQDLPDHMDFQESLHTIKAAETAFMTLPAKVRDRFGQDPAQFLAFMADPENIDEVRKLGLTQAPEVAPPPVEVIIKGAPEEPSPDNKK